MTAVRAGEVLIEDEGDVVHVTLDRARARNAIDEGVLHGLEVAVALAGSSRPRVVVLRGSGRSFCAGADLGHLARIRSDGAAMEDYMTRLGRVLDALAGGPYVSVAVVQGHAVAGGFELLLAADIVVAASDAVIGDRHLEYGLVPAAGSSVRLTRAVSRATAHYLLLTGETLDGRRAAELGLVALAVDPAELADRVDALVARMRRRSADALRVMKEMCGDDGGGLVELLRRERALFLGHMRDSADVTEGLDAFATRRAPEFGVTASAAGPGPTASLAASDGSPT